MVVVVGSLCVPLDCVFLLGAGVEIHRGPATEQDALVMGEATLAPRPNFKAVLVLAFPSRTGLEARTNPGLGQVGAVGPSVHGRGQDVSSPMLQASTTGLAAN